MCIGLLWEVHDVPCKHHNSSAQKLAPAVS